MIFSFLKSSNGCKVRDHKLRVRTPNESELYRTLMTHRDLICVRWADMKIDLIWIIPFSPSYKRNQPNSLKTISDVNSISLPSPKCLEVSGFSFISNFVYSLFSVSFMYVLYSAKLYSFISLLPINPVNTCLYNSSQLNMTPWFNSQSQKVGLEVESLLSLCI